MRRLLVAAAIGATAVLAFTAPAQASTTCPSWTLRGATGAYPDVTFGGAPTGAKVVGATEVKLVKPADGVQPGVEFATKDAGITLDAAGDITVTYQLADGAKPDAGAVRLFYYDHAGAETLTDAPTGQALADGQSGTLTIEGVTKVGTLGLVYDASNDSAGTVTFTDLKVGGEPVSFTDAACKPSPSPSSSPTPSKTPVAGGAPATTAPASNAGPTLPVTGTPVKTFAAAAAGGVLLGAVALLVSRRRRTRFTA